MADGKLGPGQHWPVRAVANKAAFLGHLDETRAVREAARRTGLSVTPLYRYRRLDPDFAHAWDAVLARPGVRAPKVSTPLTMTRRTVFLEALAEHGCGLSAAATAGVSPNAVHALRVRCADFAAAWFFAKRQAAEALDGRLLRRALDGFERTTEKDGVVTRTLVHDWRAGIAVLERLDKALAPGGRGGGGRWIEVTPARVAEAKANLIAMFVARANAPPREPVVDAVYGERVALAAPDDAGPELRQL